jgi:hypothetical protein
LECGSSYKVAFFQDEYWLWPERAEVLNRLNVDCVYTCVEPAYYESTYWKVTKVPRLETYLPGYVSEEMVRQAKALSKPDSDRRIDVGYRGRLSPEFIYWGKGALEKYEIAVKFRELVANEGLALDIETAEEERIYGDKWLAFLGNCRAVLGVEGGVSIFDIDNEIIPSYKQFRSDHPEMSLEEVYDQVLAPHDSRGVYYRSMSPRAFEAAAARTCQIHFEGRYSGILKPMVHYIPLRKDFSNFDEVIRLYRDEGVRRELTENCYRDLIASGAYSYERFMETFDAGLMAVGLKPDVSEELVRTVTDRLVENVQILLVENVTRQLLEYRELMNTHLALQRDYMSQQNQFQGLIDQHQQLSSDHEALQHRSGSIRNLLKTVLSRIWGKICRAL